MPAIKKSGLQKNIGDVDPYNLGVDSANVHATISDALETKKSDGYTIRRTTINDPAYLKKMRHLEGLPEYEKGGIVKETGLARVHKGELVIPKSAFEKSMAQRRLLGAVKNPSEMMGFNKAGRRVKKGLEY